MPGQGPVDIVQFVLIAYVHFTGQAQVIAFAARAHLYSGHVEARVQFEQQVTDYL